MKHKLKRGFSWVHAGAVIWQRLWFDAAVILVLSISVLAVPTSASERFQQRSLFISDGGVAGAVASWTLSFTFVTPEPVGSVELKFCIDPIPYMPCDIPAGLNITNASLGSQVGETGWTITARDSQRLLLSRAPQTPTVATTVFRFDNITNPTYTDSAFSIRMKSFASTDGTGPLIDFGSVRSEINPAIQIETQVPPMLIFCMAEVVDDGCAGDNGVWYTDMGTFDPDHTLVARSQFAVGTNASRGFAVTVNGEPLAAGTNALPALTTPSPSTKGTNQFGINLRYNPDISWGADPTGSAANAFAASGYDVPDQFKFNSGDLIAYSTSVNLMEKFTVSYIANSAPNLQPGIYSTSITYIASGLF